ELSDNGKTGRAISQTTDQRPRSGDLAARRERPCGCGPADERDELPSPHGLPSVPRVVPYHVLNRPGRGEARLRQAVMTLRTIAKIRNITSTLRVRGDLIGDRPMAANHIFGLGNPVPTATATLVAAILVISATPAQGQQPSADQLKAN